MKSCSGKWITASHEYVRPRDARGTDTFTHFFLIPVDPMPRSADWNIMNALQPTTRNQYVYILLLKRASQQLLLRLVAIAKFLGKNDEMKRIGGTYL